MIGRELAVLPCISSLCLLGCFGCLGLVLVRIRTLGEAIPRGLGELREDGLPALPADSHAIDPLRERNTTLAVFPRYDCVHRV